jgi:RimJ/RimL family protein N-acetyltransferase
MAYRFAPMTVEAARVMIGWRYAGDYAMYNMDAADADGLAASLADPANRYFAIYDGDELVGHCVFGAEARVPGGEYAACEYTSDALDFGLGMRPDWTGRGRGAAIVGRVIGFGRARYGPGPVRATVAAWNVRSQRAIRANGLKEVGRFKHALTGMQFVVFVSRDMEVGV